MRPETANHSRSDLVSFAFVAAAVLLGALAFAKVASFVRGERVLARVRGMSRQDPNDLQAAMRKASESAEALKKGNLFVKTIEKEHPVKQVDGILGAEVLIGDKWYKAGDKVDDAVILAVASTEVTIEWQGRKQSFAPLASTAQQPEEGPKPIEKKPEEAKAAEPGKPVPPATAAPTETAAAPVENDPLAFMGVKLSPKLRAKLLEMWNSVPESEREKAKEEWNRMPEQEREKALDMLEQTL